MSICDETEIQIIQIAILFFLFVYNKLETFPRRNFAYNDPPPLPLSPPHALEGSLSEMCVTIAWRRHEFTARYIYSSTTL